MTDPKPIDSKAAIAPLLILLSLSFIRWQYGVLLFHTLAELFSVVVGILTLVIIWHTRRFTHNDFLLYLGIGYFWIAVLDALHTFTVEGMPFFNITDMEITTHFWIYTRFIEALLLLSASLFLKKRLNAQLMFSTGAGLALLVTWASFVLEEPVMLNPEGLSVFKIGAEYLIMAMLGIAIVVYIRQRALMTHKVLYFLLASLALTIFAELSFTLYTSFHGVPFVIGHLFKFLSFWMIYQAVVQTTLNEPFSVMARTSSSYDAIPNPAIVVDNQGVISQVNRAAEKGSGKLAQELVHQPVHSYFHPTTVTEENCELCQAIKQGRSIDDEMVLFPQYGQWFLVSLAPINVSDKVSGMVQTLTNITARKQAEEALSQSKAMFESIFSSIPDAIVYTDLDRNVIGINHAFTSIFGYDMDDLTGQTTSFFYESIEEYERQGRIRYHLSAADKEQPYEVSYRKKDGAIFPGETRGTSIKTDNGTVMGFMGVIRDISERKQAEEAISQSQEILTTMLNSMDSIVYIADMETYEVLFINKCGSDIFGDLTGTTCWKGIQNGRSGPCYFCTNDRLIDADGKPTGVYVWEFQNTITNRWFECRDQAVQWVDGRTVRMEIATDITERRQVEKTLEKFFEQPINLHLIAQLDGLILRTNRCWENTLGYSKNELEGCVFLDLVHPDDQASTLGEMKKLGKGITTFYFENRYRHKNGEYRVLAWSALASTEEQLIYAVANDITEQRQTEQSLRRAQKMEAIGQLTGGIAHDFNNILGIISGNLDLLKHQVTDDKARKRVETIKGSAQRAADLTKQLLGFSRQQSTQRIRTDIRRVIRQMESLIASSLTPEIAVEQQFAEDLWQTEIDPGDFQDALLNLAINARDAMPDGGILTLEARNCTLDTAYCAQNPGATPGEYVQLAVSDNGMGIAPADREKIFEPFFTTKPPGKGTGLGLAMVYGFAKRSKGYIQVYSEQEIGATFRLYLPRAEGEEQPQEATSESTERLPRGNETLLVVDDEEELLKLAEESLLALGYRVLTASSGWQAMERLAESPNIDLLFSDVVMPGGMNGYELAERATNAYPQLKVLLTSGYTDKAVAHNGQARFAANLLSKPYSQAELAQGVRALLGELDILEPTRNEPDRTSAQTNVEAIEWTDALSIGVDAIDADHKTLLALLNRCQQAMAVKESEQDIHSILDELSDYVQTHFQREESVMAVVDYPGLENHRQVHQLLLKQVEKRRGLLKRGELTIGDLVALLHSWLLDHIDNMDGAIKPYCEGKDDLIEQALEQAGMARKKEDQS